MLTITIVGDELWDDTIERFCYTDDVVLQFEHSLVSLSKWESKFHKPFLTPEANTEEEMFGYVQAMLITPNVLPEVFNRFTTDNIQAINDYINDPMTGSTITEVHQTSKQSGERISAELVYYWMSSYQIDKACEDWHLNRLFTLIKIHHAKSEKPKKMNRQSRVQQMAEINAQRKAKLGTSG